MSKESKRQRGEGKSEESGGIGKKIIIAGKKAGEGQISKFKKQRNEDRRKAEEGRSFEEQKQTN